MRPALILLSSALVANAFIIDRFRSTKNTLATEGEVESESGYGTTCLKPGAFCAGIAGPVGTCCKGTKCVYISPDNGHCVISPKITIDVDIDIDIETDVAKCLKSGALCDGIAGPVGKCCKGLRCVNEGPDNGVCRGPKKTEIELQDDTIFAQKKCLKAGALCEGFAGPVGKCCKGLTCVNEGPDNSICRRSGYDLLEDTVFAEKKCLKAGALCEGFAGVVGKCCKGLTCVNEGPDNSICRKKSGYDLLEDTVFAQKKCLKAGASCAGIAGPTGTCCEPLQCVYDAPDRGTCRGIRKVDDSEEDLEDSAAGECIKNGATCMSQNGRFKPCCPGWDCVQDNPYDPTHGACYKVRKGI